MKTAKLADGYYKITRHGKKFVVHVRAGEIRSKFINKQTLREGLTYIERIEDW